MWPDSTNKARIDSSYWNPQNNIWGNPSAHKAFLAVYKSKNEKQITRWKWREERGRGKYLEPLWRRRHWSTWEDAELKWFGPRVKPPGLLGCLRSQGLPYEHISRTKHRLTSNPSPWDQWRSIGCSASAQSATNSPSVHSCIQWSSPCVLTVAPSLMRMIFRRWDD